MFDLVSRFYFYIDGLVDTIREINPTADRVYAATVLGWQTPVSIALYNRLRSEPPSDNFITRKVISTWQSLPDLAARRALVNLLQVAAPDATADLTVEPFFHRVADWVARELDSGASIEVILGKLTYAPVSLFISDELAQLKEMREWEERTAPLREALGEKLVAAFDAYLMGEIQANAPEWLTSVRRLQPKLAALLRNGILLTAGTTDLLELFNKVAPGLSDFSGTTIAPRTGLRIFDVLLPNLPLTDPFKAKVILKRNSLEDWVFAKARPYFALVERQVNSIETRRTALNSPRLAALCTRLSRVWGSRFVSVAMQHLRREIAAEICPHEWFINSLNTFGAAKPEIPYVQELTEVVLLGLCQKLVDRLPRFLVFCLLASSTIIPYRVVTTIIKMIGVRKVGTVFYRTIQANA